MAKSPEQRPLATAPMDGTEVWIFRTAVPEPVRARWSRPMQGWVDETRKVLHQVTGWAPIPKRRRA